MQRDISVTKRSVVKRIVITSMNEMIQVWSLTLICFFFMSSTGMYVFLEYCLMMVRGTVGTAMVAIFTVVDVAAFVVVVP